MRELLHLDLLRQGRSLLAFSGGADSSALFHLLLENGIDFDIAHVNYHTRPSSDKEEQHAIALAAMHAKTCFTSSCRLGGSDFENRAREERYRFFDYLMHKHGYNYLLTAHQLNDRLEWLMMQLCRGAGLPELLGVRSIDRRGAITVLRPLLEWDRESIETYLTGHGISYHIDESNADERYKRNFFRHRFSAPIMREYQDAIRRSFRYLEEDTDTLIEPMVFHSADAFFYAPNPSNLPSLLRGIDKQFKAMGLLLGSKEKERIKQGGCHVVGREYVLCIEAFSTYIAPYVKETAMDKTFKEECRRLSVPPKLRGYLYRSPSALEVMRRLKGG